MLPDLPPALFDRPYSGTLIIERVPAHETQKICGHSGVFRFYTNACAFVSKDGQHCRVILPENEEVYSRVFIERLKRHELGHCNGWKH